MKEVNAWFWAALCGLVAIGFAGCAPSLGKTLSVNYIEPVTDFKGEGAFSGIRVKIVDFSDKRTNPSIGEIDGRKLVPEGDIPLMVKLAMEEHLKLSGADLVLFDAPAVGGEVLEWYVTVAPGFPSTKIESEARVRVQAISRAGKVLYSAVYSGSVSKEHPTPSTLDIEKALGESMAYAIAETSRDAKVAEALR